MKKEVCAKLRVLPFFLRINPQCHLIHIHEDEFETFILVGQVDSDYAVTANAIESPIECTIIVASASGYVFFLVAQRKIKSQK